jgi:hypothetical protein
MIQTTLTGLQVLDDLLRSLPGKIEAGVKVSGEAANYAYTVTLRRFLAKVDKNCANGCWLWIASKRNKGYGQFAFPGFRSAIAANRASWLLFRGAIPRGLLVLHNCPGGDNPSCVNPDHLWLGDHHANSQDMLRKGRNPSKDNPAWAEWARGKNHWSARYPTRVQKSSQTGRAKLTEQDVIDMRDLYAAGKYTQQQLADKYGMANQMISRIIKRQAWRHV